jgi:hypothetical protein
VARLRLSGRPGKRGNASSAFGFCLAGEDRSLEKGVLARPPSSEQGNWALPGNGQVSLQKSFGGVLVQRSVVHTTQQSWCRGVTGDLARDSETAWRHVARSRGERLFPQGQRPRKGTNCLREAGVRIGVVFVGPRRQSRGINEWSVGSSRLGNEARRGRGGLPYEGRHLGS